MPQAVLPEPRSSVWRARPNHEWLSAHGVIPVSYGDGMAERIRTAASGRTVRPVRCGNFLGDRT